MQCMNGVCEAAVDAQVRQCRGSRCRAAAELVDWMGLWCMPGVQQPQYVAECGARQSKVVVTLTSASVSSRDSRIRRSTGPCIRRGYILWLSGRAGGHNVQGSSLAHPAAVGGVAERVGGRHRCIAQCSPQAVR